jgi:hypothetical protein
MINQCRIYNSYEYKMGIAFNQNRELHKKERGIIRLNEYHSFTSRVFTLHLKHKPATKARHHHYLRSNDRKKGTQ